MVKYKLLSLLFDLSSNVIQTQFELSNRLSNNILRSIINCLQNNILNITTIYLSILFAWLFKVISAQKYNTLHYFE